MKHDHHEKAAANALSPAHGIIQVPLPRSLNNWTAAIRDAEFGKSLHEGVLERGETGHHRYKGIAQSLGELVGSCHNSRQTISHFDHIPDDRKAFGVIAVEQPLVAMTAQS